jgi:hypothetical protein
LAGHRDAPERSQDLDAQRMPVRGRTVETMQPAARHGVDRVCQAAREIGRLEAAPLDTAAADARRPGPPLKAGVVSNSPHPIFNSLRSELPES